ncbi:hypothetical protein UFOVP373_23 [uncultured Caudovirales phage]|uniref:Uncharacterized protein n=1 Tax=uncultured Caudovirales phage TaxID=2100421 RepID=A0A6J7X300_9CAUD|nr:hypothetical protein UFOVP373_23 [uncultured Caudovirales phage]
MQVYQTDHNGFYVGPAVADADPLDERVWLIPAGCVIKAPPALLEGQRAQFFNGTWVVIDPEPIVEPEPEPELPPTKDDLRASRQADYAQEADPLFFMVQRGEATEAEWLDKIAEIKARYPYPAE